MGSVLVSLDVQRAVNVDASQHFKAGLYRPTAAAMIENENGKLLFVQSAKNDCWGPPKGGVEEDEDVIAGMIREMREELGYTKGDLVVCKLCHIESVSKRPAKSRFTTGKRLYYFYTKLIGFPRMVLQTAEIKDHLWVSREEVSEFIIAHNTEESRWEKRQSQLKAYAQLPGANSFCF